MTFALAEATVQPLAFAATPNDFVKSIAKASPKGWFPRGFGDEQPYWTIVGIDGGEEQGLIGEDGAIEVAKGGFSIEPFVVTDGKLATWADVQATQSLQDGYLPIPSVDWKHEDFALRTTAFARGTRKQSQLLARYRLTNTSTSSRDYTLALAVRPLQVNPPSQFLNTVGGVSPIRTLAFEKDAVSVDGKPRVFARQAPDAAYAVSFDAGMAVSHLLDAIHPVVAACRGCTGPGIGRDAVSHASAARRIARRRPDHPDDRRCRLPPARRGMRKHCSEPWPRTGATSSIASTSGCRSRASRWSTRCVPRPRTC